MADPVTTVTLRVAVEGEDKLDALNDAFDKLGESATAAAKTIGAVDTAGASAVAQALTESQTAAKAASTGIVASVRGFFQDISSGAQDAASGALEGVKGFASQLADSFGAKGVVGKVSGEIWGSLKEGINQIEGPLGEVIGKVTGIGSEVVGFGGKLVGLTTQFGAAGVALTGLLGGITALAGQLNLMGKSIGWADKAAASADRTFAQWQRFGGTYAEADRRRRVGEELFGEAYTGLGSRLARIFSEQRVAGGPRGGGPLVEQFKRLGINWEALEAGRPQDPLDWLQRAVEMRDEHQRRIDKFAQDTPERGAAERALDQMYRDWEQIGGRMLGVDFQSLVRTMSPGRIGDMEAAVERIQAVNNELLDIGADRARGEAAHENVERLRTAWFGLGQTAGKVAGKIGADISPTISEMMETLTTRLLEIQPALSKLGTALATTGWNVLTEAMKSVDLTKWSDLFKDIAGIGGGDTKAIGESLGKWISDVPDKLRAVADGIKSLSGALDTIMNVLGFVYDPKKTMRQTADAMSKAAEDSGTFADKAKAGAASLGAFALDKLMPAGGFFGAAGGAWGAGQRIFGGEAPAGVTVGGRGGGAYGQDVAFALIEQIAAPVSDGAQQIGESIAAGASILETAGSTASSSIGETFASGASNLGSTITAGAGELASGVTNGITAGAAAISATASGWGASAAAAFRAGLAGLSIPGGPGMATGATSASAPAPTGLSEP